MVSPEPPQVGFASKSAVAAVTAPANTCAQ